MTVGISQDCEICDCWLWIDVGSPPHIAIVEVDDIEWNVHFIARSGDAFQILENAGVVAYLGRGVLVHVLLECDMTRQFNPINFQ